MGQLGFFDLSRRYEGLGVKDDPLVAAMIPWEPLRPKLKVRNSHGFFLLSHSGSRPETWHMLPYKVGLEAAEVGTSRHFSTQCFSAIAWNGGRAKRCSRPRQICDRWRAPSSPALLAEVTKR